jgi:hypothetical protein
MRFPTALALPAPGNGASGGVKPHKFGGKNWRRNLAAMSAGVSDNNQRPVFAFKRAFGTRRSTSGRRPERSLPLPGVAGRYGCLYRPLGQELWPMQPCLARGWPAPLTENAPQSATAGRSSSHAGRHKSQEMVGASDHRVQRLEQHGCRDRLCGRLPATASVASQLSATGSGASCATSACRRAFYQMHWDACQGLGTRLS